MSYATKGLGETIKILIRNCETLLYLELVKILSKPHEQLSTEMCT